MSGAPDSGVPTYGMLCPIFPDVLAEGGLEQLAEAVRPDEVEHTWAEPFNDWKNWRIVREGYEPGSRGYEEMTRIFSDDRAWSAYATQLYVDLLRLAREGGWIGKLRYLLYEDKVAADHAAQFGGPEGVLLQLKPDAQGRSKNPAFR